MASQTERAALERRTQDELHVVTKQLKELQDGTSALRATLKAQEGDITSKAKAFYDLQVQNNDVVRENFDLKERLKNEYNVKAELVPSEFTCARWVAGAETGLAWLQNRSDFVLVKDRDDRWVVLAESPWKLDYAVSQAPGLKLLDVSPLTDEGLPS